MFKTIVDFLQMKGDINETHPIYRGKVFMHISNLCKSNNISPNDTSIIELEDIDVQTDRQEIVRIVVR